MLSQTCFPAKHLQGGIHTICKIIDYHGIFCKVTWHFSDYSYHGNYIFYVYSIFVRKICFFMFKEKYNLGLLGQWRFALAFPLANDRGEGVTFTGTAPSLPPATSSFDRPPFLAIERQLFGSFICR